MRFSDLPIQRKLLLSVLLSVTVAAVVLALSIAAYETSTFRPRFVEEAQADAKMLADLLVPALEFRDDQTAAVQLASLERRVEVTGSVIYLANGKRFTGRVSRLGGEFPESFVPSESVAKIEGRRVTVIESITLGSRNLGWLGIRLELPTLGQRFVGYGLFVFASVVSLGVLAVLLSYVLRRAVSGPVENLMRATQAVSEKKDYSLRVPVAGRDEFGRLAEAFNEMLSAIGTRDEARHRHEQRLARHNSGLVELAQAEVLTQGDPARQMSLLLSILSRVHRVRRVAFWRLEEGETKLRCMVGYDSEDDRHFSGAVLPVSSAPTYFKAIRSEAVLAISDAATDPVVAEIWASYLEPAGIGAMLDLPVRRHGRLVGVLCHEHVGGARRWESQEINFATAVSDRVVLILESTELHAAQMALQESEARYREMVEAAPDAIFTIDRKGRIREPNTALSRLTGWSEAHWREVALADAVLPDDRAMALAACEEVSESDNAKVLTLRLLRADGAALALECFLVPRRQTAGPGAVLCVGRDQSERLTALASQARLQDQLRHAQKMEAVGTLAGGIAHDFNNILTALLGNLELINYELPERHAARPFLNNTLQATQRARDLVRQILTFSRRQESRRRPVALGEMVAEALRLLRASLPASIEIVSQFAPNTPEILADETQIHQVMMNLATNSFHAMEATGGRLMVSVTVDSVDEAKKARHPQLRTGDFVVLTVSDTGCGMDAETQRRLFEPFFTTKPQGRGTGLGMAVVHGILQSHEALVSVQSAPGAGTTIRLHFPCGSVEAPGAVEAARPGALPAGTAAGHVLVVDDETLVAQVAEVLLRRAGFTVRSFSDSRAALAEFEARPDSYDLVITDLTMPNLGGLDLARRIRSLRPNLPVVLMTGYGGDHQAAEFAEAGVHGPLQKPFTAEVFTRTISAVLKSRPAAA